MNTSSSSPPCCELRSPPCSLRKRHSLEDSVSWEICEILWNFVEFCRILRDFVEFSGICGILRRICGVELAHVEASSMHCGSIPCFTESFRILPDSTGTSIDGLRRITSGNSSSMAMTLLRKNPVAVALPSLKLRRVLCSHDDSSSSRRVSYKRRQKLPPLKGFPITTTHDSTDHVFDVHHKSLPKTRAFEFLCDNEETTTRNDDWWCVPWLAMCYFFKVQLQNWGDSRIWDKMLQVLRREAEQGLHEKLLVGLQARGAVTLETATSAAVSSVYRSFTIPSLPRAHTNSLYIHHTTGGVGRDSVAVTVGLLHALERLHPGIGYFRPIDETTMGGHRSKLIKSIFKMKDDQACMQGITQERAYELVMSDKIDDLLEEVLKAYEACRANHDFVVIEGTSLRGVGDDTVTLNAKIAQTLGSSALLVTDAGIACCNEDKVKNWDDFEWEKRVVNNVKLSESVFSREHVDVVGAIVHRTPQTERKDKLLRKQFEELKIRYAGALPEDAILRSVQVQDVAKKLGAELLYPVEDMEVAMSTEVTQYLVATLQLSDLLRYLPRHADPTKGSVVITSAARVDILLGLIHLHESKSDANIATVVLSGGNPPPKEVHELLKARHSGSLPILSSPQMTFATAAALANVEGYITAKTPLKVERAQTLFDDNIDMNVIKDAMFQERPVRMNSKLFQHNLFTRAKQQIQTIVLPEGEEARTVQAAGTVMRRGLCNLILLGNREKIETLAKQFRVDLSHVRIIDPRQSPEIEKYARNFHESRKHKGVTLEQARNILLEDVNYFGTCMIAAGDADGMVSGAVHTTADTVRPALQIVKTIPGIPVVSSVFFMCLPGRVLVYGDCAINCDPTSEELAAIAVASADTAAAFGITPRVAMLSYATGDSNKGPLIQKVIDATAIARKQRPELLIEGPLQYDAAVDPVIAKTKMKGVESKVAGKATVLIFPDLNTGNNTYKAVQQVTGAVAMGPLLQGLRKPVNDLSRGCTVSDIVTTIALTAVQSAYMKEKAKKEAPSHNLLALAA